MSRPSPRHRDPRRRHDKIIERNTTIPARRSEVFSTAEDNQPAVDVVVPGRARDSRDNRKLGNFKLEDPAGPQRIPQIEVTFDIDANGILNVSARDKETGKEQKIAISNSTNLDESEINRIVDDARLHAEEDKKRRGWVDARNELEPLLPGGEMIGESATGLRQEAGRGTRPEARRPSQEEEPPGCSRLRRT